MLRKYFTGTLITVNSSYPHSDSHSKNSLKKKMHKVQNDAVEMVQYILARSMFHLLLNGINRTKRTELPFF